MKAWRYDAEGRDEEIDATAETLATMDEHGLLWIELQDPQEAPVAEAARVLGLDPASVEDVLDPELTPRVDNYGAYYQISLLTAPGLEKADESHRLDMLVGEKWVLTAHKGPLEFFERFRAQDKAETMIGKMSGPALAASLLDWHLAAFFEVTSRVEAAVDRLDELVLTQPNSRMLLGRMVTLRRHVSQVRARLAAQRPAFYGLARPDFALVSQGDAAPHYQALAQRFERALDEVERARDLVVGSFELLNSRTSLQTNELVKLLTVVTVIIGFCGAVAGVFGMNFDAGWMKLGDTGFAWTVGGMVLFAVAALAGAKWAKWF